MEIIGQLLESCVSTNDEARKLGEAGAPDGSWVSARLQSAGRGRIGRHWNSEPGNLFISIIARAPAASHLTWVPLAAAVGLCEFLNSRYPTLRLRIKWPNDLLTSSGPTAKIAGILCESVGSRTGAFIVIGIGLNCAHAPSLEEEGKHATSLTQELKLLTSADELRLEVVKAILGSVRLLAAGAEGATRIARSYARMALLQEGTELEWEAVGKQIRSGKVMGLGPAGELRVRVEGAEESLYAEDVRIRAVPRAGDGSPA